MAAVIEITTAPQEGGDYVFGFLDAAGWNTYVNIFIQGGVISQQIDMGQYVIADLLDEINDFDQAAIIEEANGLSTDC